MRRRHLKALSSDEFPSDGFRRSGTIGLPDCTNEAAFTKAFRAGCDSPSLGGLCFEIKMRTIIMNQVKTINELINRTWCTPATALALILFVFPFGTTTARAQGAGTGGGPARLQSTTSVSPPISASRAGKSYGLLLGSRMIKLTFCQETSLLHFGQ